MNTIKLIALVGVVAYFVIGAVNSVDEVMKSRSLEIKEIMAQGR